MEARAQKTSDSNRSLARVESKTACAEAAKRSTSKSSLINEEDVEISGSGFPGDKTSPDEETAQFSGCANKVQEGPQPAEQPETPRGGPAESRFELLPIGNV